MIARADPATAGIALALIAVWLLVVFVVCADRWSHARRMRRANRVAAEWLQDPDERARQMGWEDVS